jgi:chlorobactene glucosyltransferase
MLESLCLLLNGFLVCLVLPLLGLCLLHSLVNMRLLRRLRPVPVAGCAEQDVSILVPARNEERRIRECLASLIAQQPPVREIILLDDRSEDRTPEIARELGFREEAGSRLRMIRGEELPGGWVGKNWACHQLSRAANPRCGSLLFTDADTVHSPGCVQIALAHARSTRADLLSLWPDQITGTWSEKIFIPLGYLLFMAFQPFPLLAWFQKDPGRAKRWGVTPSRLASFGAANGQFLLFRREAYRELGGHEALRDHLVEDVAFGRRVAARTTGGMRLVNADGVDLLKCRMYSSFGELWEGFSKNLRPAFEESHAGFLFFGLVIWSLFLLPFLLLAAALLGFPLLFWPALLGVSLILTLRGVLTIRFRTSWLSWIGHPFGITLAILIALNSWRLCFSNSVSWKGRLYAGTTRSSLELPPGHCD